MNTVYKNSLSIADDDDYIESNAKKYYKKCVQTVNNSVLIDLNLIEDLHISLKKRIILYAVSVLKGNKINIENKHLEILANLYTTGKRYDIMSDLKAYIDYKKLVLCSKIPEYADYEYEIETDKSYTVNGQGIKFKLTDNTDMSDKTCMYVSADNAKKLVLRNRRNGDKFAPSGMSGEKKLNRYFIDNKISQDLRQKIPLLCINDEIAVVIGYRVSENFIVTNETKSIIKISICGGTNE